MTSLNWQDKCSGIVTAESQTTTEASWLIYGPIDDDLDFTLELRSPFTNIFVEEFGSFATFDEAAGHAQEVEDERCG